MNISVKGPKRAWVTGFLNGLLQAAEGDARNDTPVESAKEVSAEVDDPVADLLRVAGELQSAAEGLPLGSQARVKLQRLAEGLRVVAAGKKATALLGEQLDDPMIKQVLRSAGIKID